MKDALLSLRSLYVALFFTQLAARCLSVSVLDLH